MNETHVKELKLWAMIVLGAAIISELMHVILFGNLLSLTLFTRESTWEGALVQFTFPFAGAAMFFVFAGWIPFSRKKYILLAVCSVIFACILYSVKAGAYSYYSFPYIVSIPLAVYLVIQLINAWFKNGGIRGQMPQWALAFIWITIATISLGVATNAMLRVGSIIYPLTYDLHLLKVDQAYGGFARWVAAFSNTLPNWIQVVVTVIYSTLALLFFPIIALLYRENKIRTMHGWRTMIVPFGIAWICYLWLPATGPIFVFGREGFPANIPSVDSIQAGLASIAPASRNAVPSMHLSGAILIFMITAALRRKILFGFSVFFLIGTAWATLALGEHYFVDLVVAFPFAVALGIFLISPPLWKLVPRWVKILHIAAGMTFFVWMALLRFQPVWLEQHLSFVRMLSIWSGIVGLVLIAKYIQCVWREDDINELILVNKAPQLLPKELVVQKLLPAELHGNRWLVGIFFFSGFAGLVYEVVYAKALGVTFGGTALAANTVLMTYMGGMALGAWIGGIIAEKSRRPLMLYAIFEAIIGLYAALTPFLFSVIQALYVALATDEQPDSMGLTVLRMGLGAAVLGVPTVLMGATLPLVFQCLRKMGIPTSRAIAPLYAANVIGAAVGALVAGYALLPSVGRSGGTLIAAMISLMVALYVIDKHKNAAGKFDLEFNLGARTIGHVDNTSVPVTGKQGLGALIVLIVGGGVTLALEVVFMHLLAAVAGNSVYAFGLMLATFLVGLGLGSSVGERLMRRIERVTLVTWAQLGTVLCILGTSFVWDGLAGYMGSFGYAQQYGVHLDFASREMVRAMICALAMMPPAFFIGMSYPAAMGLAADWLGRNGQVARGVGIASGLNTLGNIVGVLLTAFYLLPSFGSRNVLFGLSVVALVLSALMIGVRGVRLAHLNSVGEKYQKISPWLPVGVLAVSLSFFPSQWNYTLLSQGGNVYFQPQAWGTVIDHSESVEGGITTVARDEKGMLTLLTNGKFQGNNSESGEMVAQESFALLPLLHTTQRKNALVVGYGTGMTARVLQDQGFANLDVVELSRDIVSMADKYFENINAHISNHPSVKMHYTDGRNYLLTQSKTYDLISLEITSIWFAGAANLYNKEFYELTKNRLSTQGVLQQWVQMHHMRPLDFLYVLGSARSVFKYVWIYVSGGQGIIVASNDENAVNNMNAFNQLMSRHTISNMDLKQLPKTLIAGPDRVNEVLRNFDPSMNFFVSTDKNLYLEYATPKGNAVNVDTSSILINMLRKHD